jgi:DNA-binding SARP family transcriptional activator
VRFGVLGPLQVTREGQPIAAGGARARAVLVMLLADAGRVVPAERLADALWPALGRDRGVANLQVRMAELRRALRAAGAADRIVTVPPGYRVDVTADELDLLRFARLTGSGRDALASGEPAAAASFLSEALGLWRGPALADLDGVDSAVAQRARLEEARLDAIELRIDALLASGRHAETVGEAEALTERHPLRERFWWQRMLALYRSGRQADALRAYRELRGILADQLGIEPSPELRALEARILRQEDDLRYRPASAPAAAAPQTRYVDSGGVHIAYQVIGEGERDIVFVPGLLSHLDLLWEDEDTAVFSPIPIASVP